MSTTTERENRSLSSSLSNRQRAGISLHAFINILFGFFGGMAWLLVLGEYLQFWPLPPIEMSLPETKELWRNAHTGPITNGIFILALAGMSPLLKLNVKLSKILYYASIIMLWGNTLGYQTAPYTSNRGLNPAGGGWNTFTYFSFYIAVFAAFVVVGIGIYGCYQTFKQSKSD